jgi:thiamine-monophosphate kinase
MGLQPLADPDYRLYSRVIVPLPEKSLIARIRKHAHSGPGVALGIGDDCAILRIPTGHETLVTTDFSLEGVHFRREWHSPQVVGHRCLVRGLSDIAAMGGQPIAAFLSLALPPKLPQNWVDRFMTGLLELADEFKVTLAGGDTAQSPSKILADIIVVGSAPKGKAICRSGARPRDRIYVTGDLGGSAAALALLFSGRKLRAADFPHHFHPTPRIQVGRWLREHGLASAMIDTSDGLSTDLAHICEESAVGAEIHAEAIPRAETGKPTHRVDLKFALHGGEDYELLFTAPRAKRIPRRIGGVTITQIGEITRQRGIVLIDGRKRSELRPQGWEHFRGIGN